MGKCLINGTNNNTNDGRAIQILNFLVDKGLTPTQACAICGNCFVESAKRYDPKAYNPNDNGGPSYGLFQWHDKPAGVGRMTNLKNYCKGKGLDYTSMKGQLEFLWHENAGNFKQYFSSNTNLSVDAYTKWWERHWEVCGTCHHSERIAEANRLAGLYKQLNKVECTVELTGGSGAGSGGEDGGFTCNESDSLDSSINLGGNDSSVTGTGPEGEDVTGSDNTNTVNKKVIFVGDNVGSNIWKNSVLSKNTRSFSKASGKFGRTGIVNTIKSIMSDKNNKPKSILFYIGSGFDMSWAKSATALKNGVNEWLYQVSSATGYTEIFFVSTLHPSMDVVNGTTNSAKGSYQYVLNQTIKEWANMSTNYHAHYLDMTYLQNTILNSGGYRKKSGKSYTFTNEALKSIGEWIWYLLPVSYK